MSFSLLRFAPVALLFIILFNACKKEFDSPPRRNIPVGSIITLDSLRNMFPGTPMKIQEELSVYCVVSMDEKSGNIYRNVYVQDATGAINVRLLTPGGLYQGDSIRIFLKNTVISRFNGMMQLDSVDTDRNIIKQATLRPVQPLPVSITQINSSLQSRLIRLDNVQFSSSEIGRTFANAVNQSSENRILEDCDGNTIIVRTSGFANFAGSLVPEGRGSLTAIVGEFNGTIQLYIRTPAENDLSAPRCGPYLSKNFEDNSVTSGGWSLVNRENGSMVSGNPSWQWVPHTFSGQRYARATAWQTGTPDGESWLISPSVDLSSANAPGLSFISAYNFTGPEIELYVSTNYVSGDISTGTWTQLPFNLPASGGYVWAGSGDIPLTAYKVSNFRLAIRFRGATSSSRTWQVDNFMIREY